MIDPAEQLVKLAKRAFEMHDAEAQETPLILAPNSRPILYFGDFNSYKISELKIATVGLNPSDVEFPSSDPFARFPNSNEDNIHAYLDGLNEYFDHNPYRTWFGSYKSVLIGAGSSYYSNAATIRNRALHTDLGSCLATAPTWS